MLNEFFTIAQSIQKDFIDLIPQLTLAFIIIVVGIIIAYILKWISSNLIKWTSRIIPKSIFQKVMTKNDVEKLSLFISKVVFFITLFLTVATALKKLGLVIVSSWFESVASYLPNTIAALIIFIFGWKIKSFIEELLYSSLNQVNFSQAKSLSKVASWAVFIISIIVALEQIGINVGIVINLSIMLFGIVAGGIVLTFALGAKSNISEILSCYQLSRHLKVGENIKIADHSGVVKSIGPVFIILESPDNRIALPGTFVNKNPIIIQKKV